MEPEEIVDQQLKAYNNRDLEAFLACYSESATIEDAQGTVMAPNRDTIRALYTALFANSPALHTDVPTRITVGAYVIDEEKTTGFNFPGFPTDFRAAVIYQIADGKVAKVRSIL